MNVINKITKQEVEEDDFPLPPPPDTLIQAFNNKLEINDNVKQNENKQPSLSHRLSITKPNANSSSFFPQSNNVNNSSNSTFLLKRSQTLSTNNKASSSPFNRLKSRLNSNRNSVSSFASQKVKRLNLLTNDLNHDLEEEEEEEEDEDSIDSEIDIELNNLNNHNTSSSPSSSKENTSSASTSSASSVIYSTNNTEDLNKLNDSSTTNNSNSDHYQASSNSSSSFSSSFKSNSNIIKSSTQNEKLIAQLLLRNDKTNESLIYARTGTLNRSFIDKPAPPSRSSSLQYRGNQTLTLNQKSKFLQLMNNVNENNNNIYSTANTANSSNIDRNSIYSTFSLRASNLTRISSFNLKANSNIDNESIIYGTTFSKNDVLSLNKSEVFKIETCYKSMCSIVNSSKCMAELHTTNLDNLVKLLDWKHQLSGVPVWVFNTGLNPKRKKELTLVMADKSTGFALWKLNNMTHLNDFKWTKPGHLTFKIYASNLSNPDLFGFQSEKDVISTNDKDCVKQKKKFSLKKSNSISYNSNNIGDIKARSLSIRSNVTLAQMKENYIFGAIKFESEFECSKFYDYYRSLMIDPRNDDLFNPHSFKNMDNNKSKSATLNGHNSLSFFKSNNKNTNNIVKLLYRKITKNSISSPCAFTHVNGLSVVNENAMLLAATAAAINHPPTNLNVKTNIIEMQQSPLMNLNDSGSILQNQID